MTELPADRHHQVTLMTVLQRTATTLLTAVVAPAVLFSVTLVLFEIRTAVAVALGWTAGAVYWRWVTGRPLSGLLLLTLGIVTVKSTFTLVTGNTFIYFAQPIAADGLVAVIFLGSLFTAQPLVARIAPDFCPMDTAMAARPRLRHLFRRLTLMWGLVVVVKGGLTLWLLETQSMVDFVVIKTCAILSLTLLATLATVVLSVNAGRHEGLLAPVV